jgi:hypothetical protein
MQDPQTSGVGRPRLGPIPKLFEIRYFGVFSRFRRTRTPGACECRGGRDTPMGGGDGGANASAVGVDFKAFLAPQKPTRPFGSRNGSETAQKRPSFGQAHGQRIS